MTIRVAINGFGRIGRNVVRAFYESAGKHDIEFVAVNDLAPAASSAFLLKHDTTHGLFSREVSHDEDHLYIDGKPIRYTSIRNPEELPWKELEVDLVLECTGVFANREGASRHLAAGASKVLVSAPCKDADKTIVFGANDSELTGNEVIVSNASCTTNCISPAVKALHKAIGIESGFITTIHSVTGNQVLVDTAHKDLRRARSGMENMIPTKTGAAIAVGLVVPELAGRLDGHAVRVPTLNVSMVDLSLVMERETTADEVSRVLKKAAEGELKGILEFCGEPFVSSDFNHNPHSSIYDSLLTKTFGRHVKMALWYDNEWGFSNRMLDTAQAMFRK